MRCTFLFACAVLVCWSSASLAVRDNLAGFGNPNSSRKLAGSNLRLFSCCFCPNYCRSNCSQGRKRIFARVLFEHFVLFTNLNLIFIIACQALVCCVYTRYFSRRRLHRAGRHDIERRRCNRNAFLRYI